MLSEFSQEVRIEDSVRGEEDESYIEEGLSFRSKVVPTWSKEGLGEDLLTDRQVFAQVGEWWDILLGLSDAWDEGLKAKVKHAKADATLEYKECEEMTLEVEGFGSSLGAGEGVIIFVLALMPFLGVGGYTSFFDLRL